MATTRKTDSGPKVGAPRPAPAAKKESVNQTYFRLFQESSKSKLTDAQIALKMRQAHPDKKKYSEGDVATARGAYNNGKLLSGIKAPAVKAVKVEAAK